MLMRKVLYVRVWRSGAFLYRSMARVMAASFAMLIVFRSSWDFISMCVVMPVIGLAIDAPSVGFPAFCDPSV